MKSSARTAALFFTLLLPAPATCGTTPAPQKPTPTPTKEEGGDEVVRVETALVTVPVSVLDHRGRYVPDLRAEDFRVYEDGVEQRVAHFAPVDKPFTVALLLDTSDSLRFRLEDVQEAALAFVDQLRPGDRVMALTFDSQINILSEPTADHDAVRRAIRRARTSGGTRLYDTLDFVLRRRLGGARTGRKAVVLFTDGVDTGSIQATLRSNVRLAEESEVLVYPVEYSPQPDAGGQLRAGINAPPSSSGTPLIVTGSAADANTRSRADAYLRELAAKTGARLFRAETQASLRSAFARVAEELRAQYSIGYYPATAPRPGERRRIKVRVSRAGLAVRARPGYIAAPPSL